MICVSIVQESRRLALADMLNAAMLGADLIEVRLDKFEKDANQAVAVLRADGTRVLGTVLTATGDHRFLAGVLQADRLRLSSFDGAHAFLYDARVQADGTLRGTFFSGDAWQEGFSARRDEAAKLPDEFAHAR